MRGDLPREEVARIARRAIEEDLAQGDLTCRVLELRDQSARGRILFEEPGIVCGLAVARAALAVVDEEAVLKALAEEGDAVLSGRCVAEVVGRDASILAAERVMLNFLQRLSGIATLTREYVQKVAGTSARILDTRKTTPGLRLLEKHAVAVGGGRNHRHNLADGILIKDTHIAAVGGVAEALRRARNGAGPLVKIGVEVQDAAELALAIEGGARHVLLDNFAHELLPDAVSRCHAAGITAEVSGGITLDNVRTAAESGADFISVGALTHSARALRIHMDLEPLHDSLSR